MCACAGPAHQLDRESGAQAPRAAGADQRGQEVPGAAAPGPCHQQAAPLPPRHLEAQQQVGRVTVLKPQHACSLCLRAHVSHATLRCLAFCMDGRCCVQFLNTYTVSAVQPVAQAVPVGAQSGDAVPRRGEARRMCLPLCCVQHRFGCCCTGSGDCGLWSAWRFHWCHVGPRFALFVCAVQCKQEWLWIASQSPGFCNQYTPTGSSDMHVKLHASVLLHGSRLVQDLHLHMHCTLASHKPSDLLHTDSTASAAARSSHLSVSATARLTSQPQSDSAVAHASHTLSLATESATTAATCESLLWDYHLQLSLDIGRRRLPCCGETEDDAPCCNTDMCLMPHLANLIIKAACALYRWDGLRQAVCLHKCLYYFVHDNQIWVSVTHLQLSGAKFSFSALFPCNH